jgi:superoxide dismutase, Fe-Mn family
MNKRDFLKTTGTLALGALALPGNALPVAFTTNEPYTLPPLGYAYTALEPAIDAMTMEIHYTKHHQAYVNNLNKALADAGPEYQNISIERLCALLKTDQSALRNNGGGHYNHSMFWKWIAPGGSREPLEDTAELLQASFGGFDGFKKAFSDAAKNRFGSGWAWLIRQEDNTLKITSTPNQDNPLMTSIVEQSGAPILGLDVWEHAYYLKYQNKRTDYIDAFFSIVNWTAVNDSLRKATRG